MRRAIEVVVTAVFLAVLVPLLVLLSAGSGWPPKHWSGIPLGGVTAYPLTHISTPGQSPSRFATADEVINVLRSHPEYPVMSLNTGAGGRLEVQTWRLSPTVFSLLAEHFDGDAVVVIYDVTGGPASAQSGSSSNHGAKAPLTTWATLMFGFPVQLGAGLLFTAGAWALLLKRRWTRARAAVAVS